MAGNNPNDPLSQASSFLGQISGNIEGTLAGWFNPVAAPPRKVNPPHAALPAHYSITDPQNPQHFNVPTWLLLMKTEGNRYGYGRYTNSIQLTAPKGGPLTAQVSDPAMLREILALRDVPGLQSKMSANYLQVHNVGGKIPYVASAGANARPDRNVQQMQRDLMTLGYDIGMNQASGINDALTQAALTEFRQQTTPAVTPATEAARLRQAAQSATADTANYARHGMQMTPAVANAVRNSSSASGMDYAYLMQTVKRESSFDAGNVSDTGARGLFQFTDQTWLGAIKQFGSKYGLSSLASQIRGDWTTGYSIRDNTTDDYASSLRDDPRLNALLGAELQKQNGGPNATRERDGAVLYSYQLLGNSAGGDFQAGLAAHPDAPAAASLPYTTTHGPSSNPKGGNYPLFFSENGTPKTFAQVNANFRASYTENAIFEPQAAKPKPQVAGSHKPKKPGGSTPA